MKNLRDYFDCSLFYQSLVNPLANNELANKENITKDLETFTIDENEETVSIPLGIQVNGRKKQYWCKDNLRVEENLADIYDYSVKVFFLDATIILVSVESDVERYYGSEYWENKVLGTNSIAPIGNACGKHHISFEEYYFIENDKLVHCTSMSNKEEIFDIPNNFELGDSFKLTLEDELGEENINNEVNSKKLEIIAK